MVSALLMVKLENINLLSGNRIGMTTAVFLVVKNYETHY